MQTTPTPSNKPEPRWSASRRRERASCGGSGGHLSQRQSGTVREDYSHDGNAWDYFSHDRRAPAPITGGRTVWRDSPTTSSSCALRRPVERQGPDPKGTPVRPHQQRGQPRGGRQGILLLPRSTPTHSYMKWLYKYPQAAYPYNDLIETNRRCTGATWNMSSWIRGFSPVIATRFVVEMPSRRQTTSSSRSACAIAGRSPLRSTSCRRCGFAIAGRGGLIPTTCLEQDGCQVPGPCGVTHPGERHLYCEGDVPLLFTENETNNERLFGTPNASPYVKDGINNYVVHGQQEAVNPAHTGTKAPPIIRSIRCRDTATIRLRLSDMAPAALGEPFTSFATSCKRASARQTNSIAPSAGTGQRR